MHVHVCMCLSVDMGIMCVCICVCVYLVFSVLNHIVWVAVTVQRLAEGLLTGSGVS